MPIVPSSDTLDRPAAVVHGLGSFVVNAIAPCTPSPTGKLGLFVVSVWVGGLPTGPLTSVTVTLGATVPCTFTAGPTELVVESTTVLVPSGQLATPVPWGVSTGRQERTQVGGLCTGFDGSRGLRSLGGTGGPGARSGCPRASRAGRSAGSAAGGPPSR